MPLHRFHEELTNLENNPLHGQYNILVVGTFNSAEQEGLDNDAEWFYGRNRNEFWYLFPQLLGHQSLHRREHINIPINELAHQWRAFCQNNRVIIIDIYKEIGGILPNHGDDAIANPAIFTAFNFREAFQNITFNDVIFTWKGRNNNTVLGNLKEEVHRWSLLRGFRPIHMVSPSYTFTRTKEYKLASWINEYNAQ